MVDSLRKLGIEVDYYESQGTAHEWLTWRRCLKEFVHIYLNTENSMKMKSTFIAATLLLVSVMTEGGLSAQNRLCKLALLQTCSYGARRHLVCVYGTR